MGPLSGSRIIEFAGIGPAPFCGMLLADLGADVVRIDRKGVRPAHFREPRFEITSRGKRSVAVDLKKPEAVEACLKLIEGADAVIEPFRPGVMERLGLGPEIVLERNPRAVYARVTGWGQTGPLAHLGGHDINYIAITGALAAIGPKEQPLAPMNLLGDYAGGTMYAVMGVLAGIIQARASGKGQVVDCAMSDGVASLMANAYGMYADGAWKLERGVNLLDGGRPIYDTYECADGEWIALAASEQQFYVNFRRVAGFDDDPEFDLQRDRSHWPTLKAKVRDRLKTRPRAEWLALFEGVDACVVPVLDMSQAPAHPHNRARGTFMELDGVVQPAPAPRFSATPGQVRARQPEIGEHTDVVFGECGLDAKAIEKLREAGAI